MTPPDHLLTQLKARYSEPQRHYHSWAHIEALLRHFERHKTKLHRPVPVLWALYWHDAIYDPAKPDNEGRSADLLLEDAKGHLSEEDAEFAAQIIRATTKHEIPVGLSAEDLSDMALFLDMDLSILATPAPIFDKYEDDVRAEYAFVPEEAFRAGRAAILKRFLERERLYFSDSWHETAEAPARANLERSIAKLAPA